LLENEIHGANEAGDLLIVKKGASTAGASKLIYDRDTRKLYIMPGSDFDAKALLVIGDLVEERFNVGKY